MKNRQYPTREWIEICKEPHESWTAREAKQHMEWLVAQIDEREKILLDYLGIDDRDCSDRELLIRVGKAVEKEIVKDQYTKVEMLPELFRTEERSSKMALNSEGSDMMMDIALVTAKRILRIRNNRLEWKVIRKPKSDISYNLPVLSDGDYFDYNPILVTNANVLVTINGGAKEGQWVSAYDQYAEKYKE